MIFQSLFIFRAFLNYIDFSFKTKKLCLSDFTYNKLYVKQMIKFIKYPYCFHLIKTVEYFYFFLLMYLFYEYNYIIFICFVFNRLLMMTIGYLFEEGFKTILYFINTKSLLEL